MKKIIIVLFILSSIFLLKNKEEIIIPNDSIRFRIIANSNSLNDQNLKNTIKKDIIDNVISKYEIKDYKTSKDIIKESIPQIDEIIKKYNVNYSINYGNNYFPQKTYKGVTYPEGNYDSLVITLENGLGNNFWCVLYPPLCLVDEESNNENIEYKSIVKHIIDKYTNHI